MRPAEELGATTSPPRKLTSAVSFIIAMNSFPVGGMITRVACGRTIRPHALRVAHPQGVGRFGLTVPDRLDPGSEDLRHVRPVVQPESDDARLEGREREDVDGGSRPKLLSDLRERQVDQEQLDDQRRATEERRVEAGEPVGDGVLRQPSERAEQRQDDGQDDRENRRYTVNLTPRAM